MKRFKRMDTINIVPFIDIMLVLLVIVLTSATFIAQGKIPISIPQAEGSESTKENLKSVEITINAQGEYFLDKKPNGFRRDKKCTFGNAKRYTNFATRRSKKLF